MRLERDLEPGNLTVPEISLIGCSTISGTTDGFSVVGAEATTLNGSRDVAKMDSLLETHKQLGEEVLLLILDPKIKE